MQDMDKHMKKEMLICVAEKFILGGVETYYMRMFQWAHNRNYRMVLLLPKNSEIVDDWKSKLEQLGVEIWFYSNNIFATKITDHNELAVDIGQIKYDIKLVICDNLHTYVAASYIARYAKWENANIFMYILHPEMSRCSENKLLNIGYRGMVLKKMVNNALIFMDEQTIASFEDYYGVVVRDRVKLLRIGQDIPENCEYQVRSNEVFKILSICRMDFPFKGYVLGLLDSFTYLKEKYPKIEMTLVGDGPNYEELLEKYNAMKDSHKKDIHLIKSIPYNELDDCIQACDIYVGMGTTLLDAGKNGKIGIIASANQREPLTCGYLFDNPSVVAVFCGEKDYDKYTITELLEKVILCSDDEYLSWCKKSYEVVKKEYNLNTIMTEITNSKTKNISKSRIMCVKVYDSIILYLKKLAGLR